jgi:hypothetical protein
VNGWACSALQISPPVPCAITWDTCACVPGRCCSRTARQRSSRSSRRRQRSVTLGLASSWSHAGRRCARAVDVLGQRAWVARGSYRQGRHFCATQAHGRMAAALVSLGRWEEAVRESLSTHNRYSCSTGSCTRTCIAGRASPLCVAYCDQPQQCWGAGRPEPHTEGLLRVWYRRSSTTRTDCSSSRRAHPSERAWPVPPLAVAS